MSKEIFGLSEHELRGDRITGCGDLKGYGMGFGDGYKVGGDMYNYYRPLSMGFSMSTKKFNRYWEVSKYFERAGIRMGNVIPTRVMKYYKTVVERYNKE